MGLPGGSSGWVFLVDAPAEYPWLVFLVDVVGLPHQFSLSVFLVDVTGAGPSRPYLAVGVVLVGSDRWAFPGWWFHVVLS